MTDTITDNDIVTDTDIITYLLGFLKQKFLISDRPTMNFNRTKPKPTLKSISHDFQSKALISDKPKPKPIPIPKPIAKRVNFQSMGSLLFCKSRRVFNGKVLFKQKKFLEYFIN